MYLERKLELQQCCKQFIIIHNKFIYNFCIHLIPQSDTKRIQTRTQIKTKYKKGDKDNCRKVHMKIFVDGHKKKAINQKDQNFFLVFDF